MSWIKQHKFWSGLIFIVAFVGLWIGWSLLSAENILEEIETALVEKRDLTQIVSETGIIEAARDAELTFSSAGQVSEILISEGSKVSAGDVLARLKSDALRAQLAQAQANLAREEAVLSELLAGTRSEQRDVNESNVEAARVKVRAEEEDLQQVKETQDKLVEDAREDLYSSHLEAYLLEGSREDSDRDYTPPTITGNYEGFASGEYVVTMFSSGAPSGWSLHYEGFGESGIKWVSTTQPQPLGSKGLFIEFPDNFARGPNIEWWIPVPNTRSGEYNDLQNALEQAKENRENAILQAENTLANARAALRQAEAQAGLSNAGTRSEQIAGQRANVQAARAGVLQAESNLSDKILRAPFSGTVTDISISRGEQTSSAQSAVTLISDDPYQISVNIPEVDSAYVDVGDKAEITLDAFEGEVFAGEVEEVAPTAKTIEGVQAIEVIVAIEGENPLIKTGLSADVEIRAEEKLDVIAVPSRAIQTSGEGAFVYIYGNGKEPSLEQRKVKTGLRGSGGYTEITQGLETGETVVTFLTQDQRDELRAMGVIQ